MFPLPLHVNDVMSSASWPIKGIVAGDREKAASRMLPDFWGPLGGFENVWSDNQREEQREKESEKGGEDRGWGEK